MSQNYLIIPTWDVNQHIAVYAVLIVEFAAVTVQFPHQYHQHSAQSTHTFPPAASNVEAITPVKKIRNNS